MSCAAYLCRVSQMCDNANSRVCGCNDVHTWIEEAVSECDDAFDCVVVWTNVHMESLLVHMDHHKLHTQFILHPLNHALRPNHHHNFHYHFEH
ncbi:hypothetical protein Smp_117520 [Schistosoma mansoni]|uniref:hypothetical protein n=1 Tax=Schistosoma mansoni TaxID=6183 RepID=UPI00022C8596|nr:hypothetical protein Smp_117520 [Schistosoma mansoni]|eukprot:XP_018644097.1 hypothetical protein Smp_117520 [Schistosoma mansoni]